MAVTKSKINVGLDVAAFANQEVISGIPRVIIEVSRFLLQNLDSNKFNFSAFDQKKIPDNRIESLTSKNLIPILKLPFAPFEEQDLAIFLDFHHFAPLNTYLSRQKVGRLKTIFLIHDIIPIKNSEWFSETSKLIHRRYIQSCLLVADHIVVASKKVKDDLMSLGWAYNGEIHLIPMGSYKVFPDFELYKKDKVSLICVATLEPRKGHDDLLDAFDILVAQGIDVELNIVGRYGWNSEELLKRIRQHPELGKQLFWHSHLTDEEMDEIYIKTRFAILPSNDEGFGLPLEEALSHKRVVIAREKPVFLERKSPNVKFFHGNGEDLARVILDNKDTSWDETANISVRSMEDFSRELMQLIQKVASTSNQ